MKKTVKKDKLRKNLYSAAALALCVTALFAFWMSNRNNNIVDAPENTEATLTTEEQTEPESDVEVNTPVTGVPDMRDETTSSPSKQNAYFALPLENGITKEFSNGEIVKNNTTDDWRTHNGIDMTGTLGDPVHAVNNGIVTEVYDDALWGTVVVIDHYEGVIAEYRGLGRGSTVQVGDEVKINDKVGNLGEIPIEKSDGVHLHFEIYKDGKAVSPSDYLDKITN